MSTPSCCTIFTASKLIEFLKTEVYVENLNSEQVFYVTAVTCDKFIVPLTVWPKPAGVGVNYRSKRMRSKRLRYKARLYGQGPEKDCVRYSDLARG